jgi:hypothetical protein
MNDGDFVKIQISHTINTVFKSKEYGTVPALSTIS